MKVIKSVLVMLISLLMISACSSNDRPSTKVIKDAAMAEMNDEVPKEWAGSMGSNFDPKITTLEIVEWGKYDEKKQYWPVKVHIAGSTTISLFGGKTAVRNFDKVGEFYFYKDDYDKWKWKFPRRFRF